MAPTPSSPVPALVLNVPETCVALRCGRTTVFELIASGELKGIKIGRRRLVTYDSIVDYVTRQAQAVTNATPEPGEPGEEDRPFVTDFR